VIANAVLVGHVVLGASGLLLGPAVLLLVGGRQRVVAAAYFAALTGVTLSATVPAVADLDALWWLLPFAAGTQLSALLGVRAWRRRRPGASAHLLGGTYVALVTGALVVSTGNPVFWILPALLAQWPIAVAKRRLAASTRAVASA